MNTALAVSGLLASLLVARTDVCLRGTVADTEGKPLAGVRLQIATAAPRIGPALFCPSCYLDCAKSTRSDERGRFEIHGLDPTLKFSVLASSPTKKAHQSPLVDPLRGEIKITLAALPADVPLERTVLGQVVDDRGQPIAGALVEPNGADTAERQWHGPVDVEPTATDADGRFMLVLPASYRGIDVEISTAGYAGTAVKLLKPGEAPRRIVLPIGTSVTGRVVRAGKPLTGFRLALVQTERGPFHYFVRAVSSVTDAHGKFVCAHLPANDEYAVFTPLVQGSQKSVLTTKRFRAYGERQERNLGDLSVIPGLRLAGRVELAAGETLPPNARITLGRDPAWDMIAVSIDNHGQFAIDGLPPETYEVRLAAKGFMLDPMRLPYQMLGSQSFGLRLRESILDLRVPLRRNNTAAGPP